jgi:hypothetical protein
MSDYDKVILTDVDGVLLNWGYAFDIWMRDKGVGPVNPTEYAIDKMYDIPREEGKLLVRLFNESASIGFLPPLRDAVQYVRKLHEEHGYVFHVITSLSNNHNAQTLRTMNLKKLFGETVFERFIYLDTGADKDEALAEYKDSGYIWIEDKVENAIVGDKMGLESLVMEHGYNMDDPNFPLMKNWKDIYEYLEG